MGRGGGGRGGRTGTGTPRAAEQKRGARRARDNQDWRNAGKRKGEKQKRPPYHYQQRCARCKEQDRGWLCCQKNLARLIASLLLCSPTHTHPFLPSHVWLARKEGAAPYAQVRRVLQETPPAAEVDVVVGAPQVLRPKSAPSWVAMMQAQRCIPNPHPHPNLCTHPPSLPTAEMGRDHERQIGKGPLPHRGMP